MKDNNGYTLLHKACLRLNPLSLSVVKYLIEIKGADANLRDNSGSTPIHLALDLFGLNRNDNIPVLNYLISLAKISHIFGQYSLTLLHLACRSSDHFDDTPEEKARSDVVLSQVVQFIIDRYVQLIFDEGITF
jgi:ankyrin repeat protein